VIDTRPINTVTLTATRVRAAIATFNLPPRQALVAEMVALGYADARIAASLGITANTVRTHLRHLYLRLGISTRAVLVSKILRQIVADETDAPHATLRHLRPDPPNGDPPRQN
jgi:DNA-binding CsgD family transcriptional regulator